MDNVSGDGLFVIEEEEMEDGVADADSDTSVNLSVVDGGSRVQFWVNSDGGSSECVIADFSGFATRNGEHTRAHSV